MFYDAQTMYTLRCTQRLLTKLRATPIDERRSPAPASTPRLGDWYANVHHQHHRPWMLAVSAETLLPVLVPLGGLRKEPLHERLRSGVERMLRISGVAPEVRARELDQMREPPGLARTADKSIVATLTQFGFQLRFIWDQDPDFPPDDLTAALAATPTTRLDMNSADRYTRHYLGGEPARHKDVERALATLGQYRFVQFIEAVRHDDDTLAVTLMARELDAEPRVERAFFTGDEDGFTLDVTRLGADSYLIRFGCTAGPTAGDGGEWHVTFGGFGTAPRVEGGLQWRS